MPGTEEVEEEKKVWARETEQVTMSVSVHHHLRETNRGGPGKGKILGFGVVSSAFRVTFFCFLRATPLIIPFLFRFNRGIIATTREWGSQPEGVAKDECTVLGWLAAGDEASASSCCCDRERERERGRSAAPTGSGRH